MTDLAVPRPVVDRGRIVHLLRDNGVYAALLVVLVYNAAFSPHWLTASNMKSQLVLVGPTVIVALGMALVIGTGGIDLSVGATMALAASTVGQMLQHGSNPVLTVFLAVIAGMLVGAVGGALVAFAGVQPIVATLALLVGVRGLAQLFRARSLSINSHLFDAIGTGTFLGLQAKFWDALVPAILIMLVMRFTNFGRRVVAIGDNVRASFLSGLPVRSTLMAVYIISGALAAWAGVVLVGANASTDPTHLGESFELFAITAVVVGGTPLSGGRVRLLGTIAGGVLMGWISSSLNFHGLAESVSRMTTAVVIVLAVYVQMPRRRS